MLLLFGWAKVIHQVQHLLVFLPQQPVELHHIQCYHSWVHYTCALGAEISDFLQVSESAEQALADVEAAYTAAATEKGFLK